MRYVDTYSDTETHRRCSVCNRLLPIENFLKNGTRADGSVVYRRDCKECYYARKKKSTKRYKQYRKKCKGMGMIKNRGDDTNDN